MLSLLHVISLRVLNMIKRINNFCHNLKQKPKTRLLFQWFFLIMIALISFDTMAFDGRAGYHFITYALVIILGLIICAHLFIYRKIYFDYKFIIFSSFLFWTLLCTVLGTRDFVDVRTLFILNILTYLFFYVFSFIDDKKMILYSLLAGFTSFLLYFIVVYWKQLISFNYSQRLGSYFGNENSVAIIFSYASIIICILSFFFKKHWPFIFLLFPFALCSVSTGSRKGLIILAITILLFVVIKFRKRKIILIISFAAVVTILIIVSSLKFMSPIMNRFWGAFNIFAGNGGDESGVTRLLMLQESYYYGLHNLIFGLGASGFYHNSIYSAYSHNNGGEIMCNFGIIGFLLFYASYLFCIKDCKKTDIHIAITASLIATVLLFTFTCVFYLSKTATIMFAFLLYICPEKEIIKTKVFNKHFYQVTI